MTAVIIDGRWIAENIRLGVKYAVEELSSQTGVVPGLAVVLVSDDPASGRYVAAKEKAAEESGIYSQTFRLPGNTTEAELLRKIDQLNSDDRFHGILVQFPVPPGIDMLKVIHAVDPAERHRGACTPWTWAGCWRGSRVLCRARRQGYTGCLCRWGTTRRGNTWCWSGAA